MLKAVAVVCAGMPLIKLVAVVVMVTNPADVAPGGAASWTFRVTLAGMLTLSRPVIVAFTVATVDML